jgi:hypothetical protein
VTIYISVELVKIIDFESIVVAWHFWPHLVISLGIDRDESIINNVLHDKHKMLSKVTPSFSINYSTKGFSNLRLNLSHHQNITFSLSTTVQLTVSYFIHSSSSTSTSSFSYSESGPSSSPKGSSPSLLSPSSSDGSSGYSNSGLSSAAFSRCKIRGQLIYIENGWSN